MKTQLYTPIIMHTINPNYTYNLKKNGYYEFAYSKLLNGFLDKQQYKDIGLKSEQDIKIVIPNEDSDYYEIIEKSLGYYLFQKTELNEEEFEKVNELMEAAEQIDNLEANRLISGSWDCKFLIMPEIYTIDMNGMPIYDKTQVNYYYNIFVKNNCELVNEVESCINSYKFFKKIGIRGTCLENIEKSYIKTTYKSVDITDIANLNKASEKEIDVM